MYIDVVACIIEFPESVDNAVFDNNKKYDVCVLSEFYSQQVVLCVCDMLRCVAVRDVQPVN